MAAPDPLTSWREGAAKRAIAAFAAASSDPASPGFWPEEERVAVFDNDGTLWVEQPAYTQLAFALDRLKALAPSHPEWAAASPALAAAAAGDAGPLLARGMGGVMELLAATHAGMSNAEFVATVGEWVKGARHPRFKRPYTECVYQPMLEVMALLRAHGFQVWIVSGGGVEFMRPWAQGVYGVPPERVVGSHTAMEFSMEDGVPTLTRLPKIGFVDDGAGKPVAINLHIGRRPIAAFGNSDGDFEMLQYTTAAGPAGQAGSPPKPRLGVVVRHTDGAREYEYDRDSKCGRLDKALDAAGPAGWVVVDMARDWERVFAWEEAAG